LTINACCAGVGGIKFASHWTYPNGTSANIHLEVPAEVNAGGGLRLQNVSNIDMINGRWYYIEIHIKLNTPGVANGVWEMWTNDCGTNGVCAGSPTLRARHTNVMWRASGDNAQMGSIWLENWSAPANLGAQYPSIGEEFYDNVKVSRVGPIGFAGSIGTPPPPPPAYTSFYPAFSPYAAFSPYTAFSPSTILPGDLNADGGVNALDLQLEVNVILGTETNSTIRARADLNGDGSANALDLQRLVNLVLGL